MSTIAVRPAARLVGVGSDIDPDVEPLIDEERALVERAKADREALAELYRQYLPRVHAFAYRRTGDRQAAEDITSATFEAVVRALPSFRWQGGGFGPWIFKIAANETVAHHRREARPRSGRGQVAMARLSTMSTSFDETVSVQADGNEELRLALDALSPRYQQAIALRYLTGLSADDSARSMGLAKPAFAVVLSRARSALRRELGRTRSAGRDQTEIQEQTEVHEQGGTT
jgi:RNA polymerase sigma factor (sigma-70 family)